MYSKSVTYKFTSFTSAKIAAGHCTEYLSRHVVKLEMSSLTITVSKESEVSISANFDEIGNLKKFDGLVSSLVSELRDAFDFKENNKSSVCVFNYQKETAVDTVKLNQSPAATSNVYAKTVSNMDISDLKFFILFDAGNY